MSLTDLGNPVLLDTDVLSLMMRGALDPDESGLRAYDWCVSYVTVGELAKGASMAGWDLRQWTRISDWLGRVLIIPTDLRVSYTWGQLAGAAQLRGRKRPINDMWIAAVALANDIPLATRNVKDYADFAEYHGLVLVTA
jgi:toxin FitB